MRQPPRAGGNDASGRGPRRLPDDDAPDRLTGTGASSDREEDAVKRFFRTAPPRGTGQRRGGGRYGL